MERQKVGSVMVLGAGIGGIQASLDLAEMGFKVYLIEKSPSIGGVMAQLDKTFPTNDCAMCILSPKLVDVGRHPNIRLITNAELEKLEGEPGNFKVTIRKHTRYVKESKCNGCGECVQVCPVEIKSEFDQELVNRKAIYRLFPQAIPNVFTIDKRGIPPCKDACPAKVNVQGYVALIAQGKFKEAYALVRQNNPFPSVCGRVCTHPCETACNRGEIDEPLAIARLKRFAADFGAALNIEEPKREKRWEEKVAIIGSGPAGLAAAYFLAKEGYPVTVFEALPVVGGMMAVGIPEFRLPKEILNKEIDYIGRAGVEIRLNAPLGEKMTIESLFKEGYKAIFLALGAHKERMMGIPGEDLEGVYSCIEFLRNLALGKKVNRGKKVAVIGGGNAAVDAARTALRLGAQEVFIIYRRSRKEMPADPYEVAEAEREGIKIKYLTTPIRIKGREGRVAGLQCLKMVLGEPDQSGRRAPLPIEGSEFEIDTDTVILAIGQSPELPSLPSQIELERWGTIKVDSQSLATALPGVFAGGDVVSGPATIIEAIAAGKRAATSIIRYLREGEKELDLEKKLKVVQIRDLDLKRIQKKSRETVLTIPLEERARTFKEVELGFSAEAAIREAQRCLNCGGCSECLECEKVCKPQAIDQGVADELEEVNIGSIIIAEGYERFDPSSIVDYGYGRFKNVVTSLQLERILSASGPFGGRLLRPSDSKEPKKIAFLQCIGSRDLNYNQQYCSAVCCMYAIKEAIVAKEHTPEVDCHIYLMDVRAYGKGFDQYYERAREEYKISFRRCRLSYVDEDPETLDLLVKYEDERGNYLSERYELVVLSVGIVPPQNVEKIKEKLALSLNKYNFLTTPGFKREETGREGIYVCGTISEPKDIPETVAQASAACARASELLSEVRGTQVKAKVYPPEIEVTDKEPKIGVFVCHCGLNIAGVVDVEEVVRFARTLPHVAYVENSLYTCSQDTQQRLKEKILELDLNRIVIASCTPRTHEELFQDTIREAGLNPFLLEFINIREHCSWVHSYEKEKATNKAKGLVAMGVTKAALLKPLVRSTFPVNKGCLIIGGGLSGLTASLSIAKQGYEVYLIEKEKELGGNLRHLYYTLDGLDPQKLLGETIAEVEKNKKIHIYKNAQVREVSGYVGNFKTTLYLEDREEEATLEHGAIIVATGAKEAEVTEYLRGISPQVITQRELEKVIATGSFKNGFPQNIVMIQCVGSREGNRRYCSRVCCSQAIKNALKLKELHPQTEIYILYRDVRTYGFLEQYYQQAREEGVIFIRYDPEAKPEVVLEDGNLQVKFFEPIVRRRISLTPDLLVLSTGIVPNGNGKLASFLKVPLTQDGFFLEAHIKLRPLDFSNEGIYLCGLAHSPKSINESLSQAYGAAARAATLLAKDTIQSKGRTVEVKERWCTGCGICVEICPYEARYIDEETKVAKITEVLCQGCGACASACSSGATQQIGFDKNQILRAVDVLLEV